MQNGRQKLYKSLYPTRRIHHSQAVKVVYPSEALSQKENQLEMTKKDPHPIIL